MLILVIYSIYLGYYRDSVVMHMGLSLPYTNALTETEMTLPAIVKLLPLILGMSLSLGLVIFYEFAYSISTNAVYNYFNQRIYYDQLLNNLVIRSVLSLGGRLSE